MERRILMFKPRPKQQEVLNYTGGKMGVAAVPGSGKTRTLSSLAAKLVAEGYIGDDQEVLIVTLVNSAVDNFARQIGEFVKTRGMLPNFGYRVRTLHGLSNDIVRERPGLVGLDESFQIVDERESDEILEDAALTWVRNNPNSVDPYVSSSLTEGEYARVRNNDWQREVIAMSRAFIKQAKDLQMTPDDIRRNLDRYGKPLPLAEMGWAVYVAYQRGLAYRGAVDFQDLMRLALRALELDKDYLKRLRHRWAYILEDEAQDSSKLQEKILRLLVGENGNWVRVGDPNQSIYETFTTAKPEYLREFLAEKGVTSRELPNSGRSTKSIIRLANELIDFSARHPSPLIQAKQPLQPPKIEPTPKGDPQPNPPDDPQQIYVRLEDYSPAEEVDAVVRSLAQWLPQNQDKTAAVLVPRNDRGAEIVGALKKRGIEVVELLRSTSSTRETAGALALIFEHLSQPVNPPSLASVYTVWRRDDRENADERTRLQVTIKALKGCKQVEDFVQPQVTRDWLELDRYVLELMEQDEVVRERLYAFRRLLQRWHQAALLPVDQLILTLSQDLFDTAADLAIAYSLAVLLRRDAEMHTDWRLPQFTQELTKIARNKRRVVGLSNDDTGFDPEQHKGKVTVATMHRAKGLEWDRVYLLSVNNYDFPSDEPQDTFISEKWFVRDGLSLEAETLEQLNVLHDALPLEYVEGESTQRARLDYVAERLRLFYVGITRARKELVITWNTGRDGKRQPATPLLALQAFWEKQESKRK
jgi:DNA helicase II / ATP-dependent DNA helicase PcrA